VDGVIAPSIKIANYIGGIVPGALIRIIPNGVDRERIGLLIPSGTERERLRESVGLREHDFVLIFVGRIGAEKRVFELLETVLAATKDDRRVRLLVVGDGPALPALTRKAAAGPGSDAIRFTGAVPWESVITYYSIADAFLTVSLSEVHPMTVIEAIVCGLPVIARRDTCFTDLVHDGENGFLVNDDRAAVGKILELARDRGLLEHCSAASRSLSSQLSVDRTAMLLEQFCAEVIARRAGGRFRRST
jgi:1,2-diacylglycerol 3-alpha-glucosyltransferase